MQDHEARLRKIEESSVATNIEWIKQSQHDMAERLQRIEERLHDGK